MLLLERDRVVRMAPYSGPAEAFEPRCGSYCTEPRGAAREIPENIGRDRAG